MTYSAARKEIQAAIAAGYSTTDIAWDNVEYSPTEGQSWVRVSIQPNLSQIVAKGGANAKIRRFGILFVQVFVPDGEATPEAESIAEEFLSLLEAQQLASGLTFREAVVRYIGNSVKGWYQTNISIEYYFDDLVAVN